MFSPAGTKAAEGCPNKYGKSFAISSTCKHQVRKTDQVQIEVNEMNGEDLPGFPAAEDLGPSTMANGAWRTEGRRSL